MSATVAPLSPAIGELVIFDYAQAAVSCCLNGGRVRGIGHITGTDSEGWLIIDAKRRVRQDEITFIGSHDFEPDASGYGCLVCGFNAGAEVHPG